MTKKHPLFALFWYGSNAVVFAALVLLAYGLLWDYSTNRYLKGFADGIIPLAGTTEQKSKALLDWLVHTPGRIEGYANTPDDRDPVDVLRDERLLNVCGTSANAFINLAEVSGVKTRRLLLVDAEENTKHVVVEVWITGRWVVVDPVTGAMFKDNSGRLLTKEELRDPRVLQDAIARMPGYSPDYTFEYTANIRMSRLPFVGKALRKLLSHLFPGWEEWIDWGYIPEHAPLWPILTALVLLPAGLVARYGIDRYGRTRLGVRRVRLRDRLIEAGRGLLFPPI